MPTFSLIDPPSAGASIEDFEAFLAKAAIWPQDDSAVRSAIERVKRSLTERKKMEASES